MSQEQLKIGLYDDHPVIRLAVKNILIEALSNVLFETGNKNELYDLIDHHQPEIVVLDILTPDTTGLEIFQTVNKYYPACKMIAYSSMSSPILVENLFQIGIKGFVNKKQDISDLVVAVQIVANDELYIPEGYEYLKAKFRISDVELLSTRETEVLQMIATELTSKEIADKLHLSLNTVENHRKNLFKKMKVKNLAGLIMEATRQGYIS